MTVVSIVYLEKLASIEAMTSCSCWREADRNASTSVSVRNTRPMCSKEYKRVRYHIEVAPRAGIFVEFHSDFTRKLHFLSCTGVGKFTPAFNMLALVSLPLYIIAWKQYQWCIPSSLWCVQIQSRMPCSSIGLRCTYTRVRYYYNINKYIYIYIYIYI